MIPRVREPNGFTLIELLVVLAIMGLIATLALPLAARAVDDAALRSDARNLATRLSALPAQATSEQRTITVDPASLGSPNPSHDARITVPEHGDPLLFYPDGTSSGGTLRIAEHGHAFDLDVAWLTGRITLRAAP